MSRKRKITKTAPPSQADMLSRFQPMLSAEQFQQMQMELAKPIYPALRINPLKVSGSPLEIIEAWSKRYNWHSKPVPFCENGFWITDSALPISKTIEHSLGHYYIQDAASMLPPELFTFGNTPAPLILDLAASPGGKTTHLASRSSDRALIIANDSSRDRLAALRLVLQNWGTTHTAVSNYPGEYFGSWFPETFDAVLLDAPCSMQGLRDTESHPLKSITQKEIENLARRQIRLLSSAIHATRPGGEVVYSTCTLTVEENEAVLDFILKKYGAAVFVEPVPPQIHGKARGLDYYNGQRFHPQVAYSARLWPHLFGTAGFFAARIRKIEPIAEKSSKPPARPLSQAGWHALEPASVEQLYHFFARGYELPLEKIIDENQLQIWKYQERLFLFPQRFIETFADLPVQSLGLSLAQQSAEEMIPAHEFMTRFGHLATSNFYKLDEEQSRDWMRGEDLPVTNKVEVDGTYPIIMDANRNILGIGKTSSHRIRNMLPNRARISGQMA